MANRKMEHICSTCENCINCPATDDDLFLDDTGHVAECKRYKKNNKKYLVIVEMPKAKRFYTAIFPMSFLRITRKSLHLKKASQRTSR